MSEFKKIDNVLEYVKKGLADGTLVPVKAEKFARIIARKGRVGEQIITWSESNGEPVIERVDTVKFDEKTNKPGWVVTKANEDGTPVIDRHGHTNDWIIEDSKFVEKYEFEAEDFVETKDGVISHSIYRPTGGTQIFVRLTEDVCLEQWGDFYNIGAGGYINITNFDDIYGISQRDFDDTYRISETAKIKKLS